MVDAPVPQFPPPLRAQALASGGVRYVLPPKPRTDGGGRIMVALFAVVFSLVCAAFAYVWLHSLLGAAFSPTNPIGARIFTGVLAAMGLLPVLFAIGGLLVAVFLVVPSATVITFADGGVNSRTVAGPLRWTSRRSTVLINTVTVRPQLRTAVVQTRASMQDSVASPVEVDDPDRGWLVELGCDGRDLIVASGYRRDAMAALGNDLAARGGWPCKVEEKASTAGFGAR